MSIRNKNREVALNGKRNGSIPQTVTEYRSLEATETWVENRINATSAYYLTYNADGDAFPTYSDLVNASVYYSGGKPRMPTRNDYAIVEADETHGGARWRYIYGEAEDDSSETSESGEQETPWEPQYPITTGDYEDLDNKPSINGIEMSGDVTLTGVDIYMDSSQGAELITVAIKGTDDKATEALARADAAATKADDAAAAAAEADYKANQARTLAAAAQSSANYAREEAHAAQDTANHADAAAAAAQNTADQARIEAAVADEKAVTALSQATQIEEKIPAQASSTNQLADKDFVNSSIATSTATFRGTSDAATLADFEAWLATLPADNNDYVFWKTVDSEGNTVYKRYKYSDADESHDSSDSDSSDEPLLGHWLFEYELNNSSFTAEQWAAINSGITRGEVERIADIVPSTQTPSMDGVGNAGTADSYARGDHVHPTDTSRASKADATLTERFSEWTFSPATIVDKGVVRTLYMGIDSKTGKGFPAVDTAEEGQIRYGVSRDLAGTTEQVWSAGTETPYAGDITATRTALPGYILGPDDSTNPNRDKPLASEAEAEALRTGKSDKSDVARRPEMFGIGGGVWVFANDGDGFVVINGEVTTLPASKTRFENDEYIDNPNLSLVYAPKVTTVGDSAFDGCAALASVSLPAAESIGSRAFADVFALTSVSLPAATTIGDHAFSKSYALTTISLPVATTIREYAFNGCVGLTSLDLSSFTKAQILDNASTWDLYSPSGQTITITASDETFTFPIGE